MRTGDNKMQIELKLKVDSETAKNIIRYAELLERVKLRTNPDAERIVKEITMMLDNEDMRSPREVFLEKSKSFTVFNCANNVNAQDPEWIKTNPDHCYCKNMDSRHCYDCEVWEPIEGE